MVGMCGLGDLVLTCASDKSRNFAFGLALGRGASVEQASGGMLKVTTQITINRKSNSKSTNSSIAIWLSGAAEKSPATETLSFTPAKPEALQADLLRRLFRLTGNRLEQLLAFPPITPAAADETPLHALQFHFTRLHWEKFGRSLNPPRP